MDVKDLKRKISALMSKAYGTDNQHEADMFMSKAREMLDRYNLQAVDLREDDELGQEFADTWKKNVEWHSAVIDAVAKLFDCKIIRISRYKRDTVAMVLGRESSRITFNLMWKFIRKQVNEVAVEIHKSSKHMNLADCRLHVASALNTRIRTILREREQDYQMRGNSADLIVVDELEGLTAKLYPSLKTVSIKNATSRAAVEAAQRISLDKQVRDNLNRKRIG